MSSINQSEYIPKKIPITFPITKSKILHIFERVRWDYSDSIINQPIITYDPNLLICFGASINKKMILNLYYLPRILPKEKVEWWIEFSVFRHEFEHYYTFPYDASTIMRYLFLIKMRWKELKYDQCIFLINCFSDIIVDWEITKEYPIDFKESQYYWIKWIDDLTKKNGVQHTDIFSLITSIFEIKWNTKIIDNVNIDIIKNSRKIIDMLESNEDWEDIFNFFIDIVHQEYYQELEKINPSSITLKIDEKLSININRDNKKSEMDQTIKYGDFPEKTENYLDILLLSGNPYKKNFRSSVSNIDEKTEINNSINELLMYSEKTGRRELISDIINNYDVISNAKNPVKFFLRNKAIGLLKYESNLIEKEIMEKDGYESWNYSDGWKNINLKKSIMSNPSFFLPPFSKKDRFIKGKFGRLGEYYKDILIFLDTSKSMSTLSNCEIKTKMDYAVLTSFAILYSAVEKQVSVSIINFSENYIYSGWMKSTEKNIDSIENFLLISIGSLTNFPETALKRALSENNNCLIIVITDGRIRNIDNLVKIINDKHEENPFFIFLINDKEDEKYYEKLVRTGVKLFIIKNLSDLPAIVLKETNKF